MQSLQKIQSATVTLLDEAKAIIDRQNSVPLLYRYKATFQCSFTTVTFPARFIFELFTSGEISQITAIERYNGCTVIHAKSPKNLPIQIII
ncbi:hypothetical protein [Alteromonas sp.]|uniref:hypothetical protein n=1 Tax=Alteromonas sp. TaxID=232 RepID=UPI000C56575E|nr:hypothetical protein [Alteromonas sp.]MAI36459.1 hypothetical protein [Alteromonas sp.]|tara:strand:- start:3841 stop:4113 length:273 start_codon:yes stop_codon:yes gene_type:complete